MNGFATSSEGLDIIGFHEIGYKLADRQEDLTPSQKAFLKKGIPEFRKLTKGGAKEVEKNTDAHSLRQQVRSRRESG